MNSPPIYNSKRRILAQEGSKNVDEVTISKKLIVFLVRDLERKNIIFNPSNKINNTHPIRAYP